MQLKRDFSYWIFIITGAVFYLVKEISENHLTYAISIAGIFIFLLFNYHNNRKDFNFIGKYFKHAEKNFLVTYNLLSLPITVALLLNSYFYLSLAIHLLVSLLPFTKFKASGPKFLFISRYLPPDQFEWIAGTRKNLYAIILLLFIALFLSPVKFFGVLALFLLNSILLGFYNFFEPLTMLNPEGLDAEMFLKRKVLFSHKILLIVNAPLLLFNSILHPDVTWFNACFLTGFLVLASCFIYLKYANYKPNTELSFQIDSLLLFASTIIPFLLPLSLLLARSYKQKALENLSTYIDDNS
ncbi:hypothetical protein CNR22_12750 [Sphingobacteriaceae bacterium]|nr:hypothetical protein CNR22_12750 [Sphingobacteriaceae bacterium]